VSTEILKNISVYNLTMQSNKRFLCFLLALSVGWVALHVAFERLSTQSGGVGIGVINSVLSVQSSQASHQHDEVAHTGQEPHGDESCFSACSHGVALTREATFSSGDSECSNACDLKPFISQFLAERIERPKWNTALAV
jgi:hypothetical protein